jgi:hypothetical protein
MKHGGIRENPDSTRRPASGLRIFCTARKEAAKSKNYGNNSLDLARQRIASPTQQAGRVLTFRSSGIP